MRIRRRGPAARRGCHASSRKRRFLLSITWFAAVAGVAAPSLVRGYAFGPPDGYAGDPPAANNCTFCHSSFPLNSGDGDLRLLNAPTTVTPGQSYDLLVELLDPGQS